jgi:trehalose 6-phosphate phosphatase
MYLSMERADQFIDTPVEARSDIAAEARIAACVSRSIEVLRRAPSALVTDIDGTISEMAPAPNLALVDPGALESLETLSRSLALVGVVTGRELADAMRLTGQPDLLHVGNHGYERVHLGIQRSAAGVTPYLSGVAEAAEAVRSAAVIDRDLVGVIVENKRFTASFHYRLSPVPSRADATIRAIIEPIASAAGLKISEGKMVIELRPPLTVNKGVAIAEIITEHELNGMIFFGDDVTDIDGFDAIRAHRSPTFDGLAVAIVTSDSNPLVAQAADLQLDGVWECIEVLRRLALAFSDLGGSDRAGVPA